MNNYTWYIEYSCVCLFRFFCYCSDVRILLSLLVFLLTLFNNIRSECGCSLYSSLNSLGDSSLLKFLLYFTSNFADYLFALANDLRTNFHYCTNNRVLKNDTRANKLLVRIEFTLRRNLSDYQLQHHFGSTLVEFSPLPIIYPLRMIPLHHWTLGHQPSFSTIS